MPRNSQRIEETGTGWTIPPGDVEAIIAKLETLIAGGAALEYDDARLAPYVFPAPAEALEAEMERAIALRAVRQDAAQPREARHRLLRRGRASS